MLFLAYWPHNEYCYESKNPADGDIVKLIVITSKAFRHKTYMYLNVAYNPTSAFAYTNQAQAW